MPERKLTSYRCQHRGCQTLPTVFIERQITAKRAPRRWPNRGSASISYSKTYAFCAEHAPPVAT